MSKPKATNEEHTIHELLEAEKNADAVVQRAQKEKEKKIADAHEKSIAAHLNGKKKIEQETDEYIAGELKNIEQKKKAILKDYAKQAELFDKNASSSIKKSSLLLLDKLQQSWSEQ